MKSKSSYTPWVARNAPTFNKALNTTYIKLSTLVPIISISLCIGGLTAFAAHNIIESSIVSITKKLSWPHQNVQNEKTTIQTKEKTQKAITIIQPEKLPFIETENDVPQSPFTTKKVDITKDQILVPPIPMTNNNDKKK